MDIYGIKNCNTVKKALDWLTERGVTYTFHDFKKEGVSEAKLLEWEKKFGWEKLVNKKGTTWRKLSPKEQADVVDAKSAIKAMQANPSMIKRPIVEGPKDWLLGFDEAAYTSNF